MRESRWRAQAGVSIFRAMKATTLRLVSSIAVLFLFAGAARAGAGAITEELAVVQAIAKLLVGETARPYDYLYYASEFSARKNVAASLADPDRAQFCGLTREEGLALVKEITFLNMEPVEFDKPTSKVVGLNLGHKQFPRFRYLKLSRVVFGENQQHAWLAADLNGESGAIYRVDKINGGWSKTARCGGWVKASD